MDQTLAHWTLSYQLSHADSTLHFFLGLHLKLKQYGGWIKPIQYRLHLSTVQCVIRLCNSL